MNRKRVVVFTLIIIFIASGFAYYNRYLVKKEPSVSNLDPVKIETSGKVSYSYPPTGKYYIDEDIQRFAQPSNMAAYEKIYNAIDSIQSEVDISEFKLSKEEIEKLQIALGNRSLYEFFYYKDFKVEGNRIKLLYFQPKNEIDIKKKALNEKINFILENIVKPEYSDLQKELALYRYITENTDYDFESLKSGSRTDMYTTLIEGKAICYNYAAALKYLLNRVGIEAHTVSNIAHAWNIVKIDGEYYHLDATAEKDNSLWKFNFTDSEMEVNFNTTKGETFFGNQNFEKIATPACTSSKFSYLRAFAHYAMVDKTLYYVNVVENFKLYKMDINGENNGLVSDEEMLNMVIKNNIVYYVNYNDKHLYKMNTDGTGRTLLDDTLEVNYLKISDDTLFYGVRENGHIKQLNLNASL